MSEFFTPLLTWIGENPFWAGLAVFVVAFSESVAIVGLLIPGVVMMFGFGALIATGILEFWPVFWWAVAGAVVGDGLSFWLGRHFQERLQGFWPFSRHPATLERGIDFFQRFGGKSVALGRFFGPVRAIIPLVAGMLGMSPPRFVVANVLSALVWAPAYLLPGIVFGASLELASEVAFRLVALMLLLLFLAWLLFILARTLFRLIQPHATTLVQWGFEWGQMHRGFRSISSSLADPNHPEARGLAFLATLLLLATLLFVLITGIVLDGSLTKQGDLLLYSTLQSLRTPWGDQLMVLFTGLGDLGSILLIALGIAILLLIQGHRRAFYYLIAATAFGLLAPLLLKYSLRIPRPPNAPDFLGPWSFPSAHVLRSVTLYGFVSIMIARTLVREWRWFPYSIAALAIGAVSLSRLYLGVHWATDILASLTLGVAWIALLGIAYYRHVEAETQITALILTTLLLLLIGGGYGWFHAAERSTGFQRKPEIVHLSPEDWQRGNSALPRFRSDIFGHKDHPLNIQLAGDQGLLVSRLRQRGWEEAEMLGWNNILRLLTPRAQLTSLPVPPQVHDARHEELVMVKQLTEQQRLLLRLWPTALRLAPDELEISIGNVTLQKAETVIGMLTIPRTIHQFERPVELLRQELGESGAGIDLATGSVIRLQLRPGSD
ncbi:MAG: phosphoesterase PA-phosphatase [gamma proteobacterium symbiont of Ctena orbiculata]|uniref:VTT domain-containing protein n=1 Tax=Candidatus Thiodiazotropha taylori TaxID=2792791 RepID=A0A944QUI0_9GAMM|nr:VTT domain-containing protein [Candidatus Thiodiazotropha taylori]PUB84081.1 MAG: phosphoesterase PA-phosphatase [gamma proteobacterium symbiont of Ctena orbiculata]MBT2988969.1 VTT domain-containing protein [Candidatus Thiodiazotropha taylori]MBT2996385.1 VTT domain-containing protein [Candidatus Thiodiazotropha taylori]MBT3000181.1 VTT domain-containing protein [Candidatus Thiodiazotropha taylori]